MVSLHHFQVTTGNLLRRVSQFQSQFGFKVLGHRQSCSNEEVALYINSVVMVIRGVNPVSMETLSDWISDVVLHVPTSEQYDKLYVRVRSCGTDVESSSIPLKSHSCTTCNSTCSTELQTGSENFIPIPGGMETRMFRIVTPFRSVCHTVMCGKCNCVESRGGGEGDDVCRTCPISCLPGFVRCPRLYDMPCTVCSGRFESSCRNVPHDISHVDHVTFACHTNSSDTILEW